MSGFEIFLIPILPSNNNKPLDHDFIGTLLHTFTASDSDGDTVFFFLGDFNGKELFSIGSTTGRLILAQALDREVCNLFNVYKSLKLQLQPLVHTVKHI